MSKKPNVTNITIENNVCPIPLESLAILVSGDSNSKFKVINKKITPSEVRVKLKHRDTSERVYIVVPREFLESHKIFYKDPVLPTNKQIEGVLDGKVKNWEIAEIITDLSDQNQLVIAKCLESGKLIGCKVPTQDIEKTQDYISKCKSYKQSFILSGKTDSIIWREPEWQREVQVKLNLSAITRSIALPRV